MENFKIHISVVGERGSGTAFRGLKTCGLPLFCFTMHEARAMLFSPTRSRTRATITIFRPFIASNHHARTDPQTLRVFVCFAESLVRSLCCAIDCQQKRFGPLVLRVSYHFGVSGIREAWKYHGQGFYGQDPSPWSLILSRIESRSPTKPPLWLGVTSVNHLEPLVERLEKEKDPRN